MVKSDSILTKIDPRPYQSNLAVNRENHKNSLLNNHIPIFSGIGSS
jgi:multidrug resistance efflux pump